MPFLSLSSGSIMMKMMQATEEWHLTEPIKDQGPSSPHGGTADTGQEASELDRKTHIALGSRAFKDPKVEIQELNIRTHTFWSTFFNEEDSSPSTPGIHSLVQLTEVDRLTMSWFDTKPATPSPKSPSTLNTFQDDLATQRTTCPSCSTSPTNGQHGKHQITGSVDLNKPFCTSTAHYTALNGSTGAKTWELNWMLSENMLRTLTSSTKPSWMPAFTMDCSDKSKPANYWTWASSMGSLYLPEVARREHFSSMLEKIFGNWVRVTRVHRWKREATKAAWSNNDSLRYFKLVNSLTPKHRPPRPQLRKSEGQLMSPEEELKWITEHMAEVFAGKDLEGVHFYLLALPSIWT